MQSEVGMHECLRIPEIQGEISIQQSLAQGLSHGARLAQVERRKLQRGSAESCLACKGTERLGVL